MKASTIQNKTNEGCSDYFLIVITQVFPDEFHLNTLDQLLPAIARLNPHVNIKAIVIGLMDRLSAYAERESESESQEDRKKSEEEATTRLLEKLRISKENKLVPVKDDESETKHTNGEITNGDKSIDSVPKEVDEVQIESAGPTSTESEIDSQPTIPSKSRGIPDDVKLYEIFYGQVTHLVNAQRLPIQDTIALLVSLSNLAL